MLSCLMSYGDVMNPAYPRLLFDSKIREAAPKQDNCTMKSFYYNNQNTSVGCFLVQITNIKAIVFIDLRGTEKFK